MSHYEEQRDREIVGGLDRERLTNSLTGALNSICIQEENPTIGGLDRERLNDDVSDEGAIEKAVNHPDHYTSHPSGIECIQITEHYNFCIGNAMKYLWRNGLKDGNSSVQDLKKAVWYIEREIKNLSN